MTDENGSTINGTCVIFYERLAERLVEPVNEAIQDWVKENMVCLNIYIYVYIKMKEISQE